MKSRILSLTLLLSLSVAGGCSGFGAGFTKTVSGQQPTLEEQAQLGYNVGQIVANVILAATGYFARTVQDKVIPAAKKKEETTVRQ